jgi:dolichyl-phosphate-mannose-protein mannosyltransferase
VTDPEQPLANSSSAAWESVETGPERTANSTADSPPEEESFAASTPVPDAQEPSFVAQDFPPPANPRRTTTWPWLRGDTDQLTTIERLRDGQSALSDRLGGWIVTLTITALAFVIRLVNLGYPNKLVFDETYYAKDAWTLWLFGYERDWPDRDYADAQIASGNTDIFSNTAAFVVHPPVGKWLIGFGEQLFGMNSFGWRFMPLVFGTLLVFMTIRMARRLSRSTLIGGIAGVLLTFDGLAFTMSRIALLDIFQAFFLVAAVAAVVADRDWYRSRLAATLEHGGVPDFAGRFGPVVWLRPWRLTAGLMLGLAIGTKWNSVYLLISLGILSVIWDVGARRLAGASRASWWALLIDGVPAFIRLVVVSALVYVASWWAWLAGTDGYLRDWGENNPNDRLVQLFGTMWGSFLHFHQEILAFHTGDYIKSQTHPYNSPPGGWLLMLRPIGIDAVNGIEPGVDGCQATGTETCVRVISGMGTPILWWLAFAALLVALVWWVAGRDWRFGVPIIAAMSTYLFWFPNSERPVFFFYAICIIPFTVTLLAMVMGLILGPRDGPKRLFGAVIVGVAIALVMIDFAFIYPILTDQLMLRTEWYSRMWLQSWI